MEHHEVTPGGPSWTVEEQDDVVPRSHRGRPVGETIPTSSLSYPFRPSNLSSICTLAYPYFGTVLWGLWGVIMGNRVRPFSARNYYLRG